MIITSGEFVHGGRKWRLALIVVTYGGEESRSGSGEYAYVQAGIGDNTCNS